MFSCIHPIVINSWKNLDIFSEILYPTIDEGYYEKIAKRTFFTFKSQIWEFVLVFMTWTMLVSIKQNSI